MAMEYEFPPYEGVGFNDLYTETYYGSSDDTFVGALETALSELINADTSMIGEYIPEADAESLVVTTGADEKDESDFVESDLVESDLVESDHVESDLVESDHEGDESDTSSSDEDDKPVDELDGSDQLSERDTQGLSHMIESYSTTMGELPLDDGLPATSMVVDVGGGIDTQEISVPDPAPDVVSITETIGAAEEMSTMVTQTRVNNVDKVSYDKDIKTMLEKYFDNTKKYI
jgi:hypothetical protein